MSRNSFALHSATHAAKCREVAVLRLHSEASVVQGIVQMAPKVDPSQVKIIFIRVVGGEGAGASLAQKVGPYGVPAKKVSEDIAKCTQEYKSLRLVVKITIQNRAATIELCPGVPTMIVKALKEPPRDRKKVKNIKHSGSISLAEVITIAKKSFQTKSLASNLANCVKEVLGTCRSIGCMVDGKKPADVVEMINNGEITIPM